MKDLDALSPKELRRRIVFDVLAEDSDPHEVGPLTVTIDPQGISLHWMHDVSKIWDISWSELRAICDRADREAFEEAFEQAEREKAWRERAVRAGDVVSIGPRATP